MSGERVTEEAQVTSACLSLKERLFPKGSHMSYQETAFLGREDFPGSFTLETMRVPL